MSRDPGSDAGPTDTDPAEPPAADSTRAENRALVRRHLRFGWLSLLVFLLLGVVLETLHGFKIGYYLDVQNHTRRLMWTLAHAHGSLLSLINVAFAVSLPLVGRWAPGPRSMASRCLLASTLTLPSGFFLGGVFIHGGDPGLGIVLVPVGALLLAIAVFLAARGAKQTDE